MTLEHHGIWWIILLLYAHIIHTSVSILECPLLPMSSFPVSLLIYLDKQIAISIFKTVRLNQVYSYDSEQFYLQRWIVNGNIECFTGWHAPLALLAIAVLVVTVTLVPLVGLISVKQHLFKVTTIMIMLTSWPNSYTQDCSYVMHLCRVSTG